MADEMMIVENETAITNHEETFADRISYQVRESGFMTEEEIMRHAYEMEAEDNEKEN